jgi:phosphate uptake regulator
MNEHIVKSFDQELLLLDKKIAQMGGLAERLLAQAFDSLEKRDPKLGESVVSKSTASRICGTQSIIGLAPTPGQFSLSLSHTWRF